MKILLQRFGLVGTTLTLLLFVGCLLSGTFVLEETFYNLTPNGTGNYYYQSFDITSNSVWKDHSDNIQDIDNIGFEVWLTSTASANTFNCYVAPLSSALNGGSSNSAVQTGATHVLVDLPLPTGESFIGYATSFTHLSNLSTLKSLAESGQFKFWAMSDVTTGDFTIDSIRVVITLTAGT